MSRMEQQQFLAQTAMLLSNPGMLCDICQRVFFPENQAEFERWCRVKVAPQLDMVYDWLAEKYEAPARQPSDTSPEPLFRELLKYMVAKALNMKYTPAIIDTKIIN